MHFWRVRKDGSISGPREALLEPARPTPEQLPTADWDQEPEETERFEAPENPCKAPTSGRGAAGRFGILDLRFEI